MDTGERPMKFDASTITALAGLVTAIGGVIALLVHRNGPLHAGHGQPEVNPAPESVQNTGDKPSSTS